MEPSEKAFECLTETLKSHTLEHLLEVNGNLRRYCDLFMGPQHFDFLVHLVTEDLVNVYGWRAEQEHALRQKKKKGGCRTWKLCGLLRGICLPTNCISINYGWVFPIFSVRCGERAVARDLESGKEDCGNASSLGVRRYGGTVSD